ncbi:IclR family transcriptional regulator [Raineyella sp. W15-4]|uniref:IclR family transcriptional regulator n=1 Tax=Raineyella sp. W15-4 TaxID=3081651 RepID=UPI0029548985|nr:IclR family transcriptional regulator [Raineyella sp. W15-4]WOQ16542.1 IclR family transcriptional regulator [Raineyella sp. W15-4]
MSENVRGLELLSKADGVLRALEHGGNLSVSELAALTGEPLSSMYRLLSHLVSVGWVDKGAARATYRLGLYTLEVGGVCDDRLDLLAAARPELSRLRDASGGTAFLHVPHGTEAVCVDRLAGRGVRSLKQTLGGSLPLYAGAGPRALLAQLPPGEAALVLDAFEQQARTDPEVPPRSQLEHERRRDAARGYAVSDGDVTPGVAAMGAPIFNHRGELVASISVSGLRPLVLGKEAEMSRLVIAAAERVSAGLGFRAPEAPGAEEASEASR